MLYRLRNNLPENLRVPDNIRYSTRQSRTSNWRRLLKTQTGKSQKEGRMLRGGIERDKARARAGYNNPFAAQIQVTFVLLLIFDTIAIEYF